jgi:hypothetical protein
MRGTCRGLGVENKEGSRIVLCAHIHRGRGRESADVLSLSSVVIWMIHSQYTIMK